MEKIRQDKRLIEFIKNFYYFDNKKIIACIRGGHSTLISAKIVKGKLFQDTIV